MKIKRFVAAVVVLCLLILPVLPLGRAEATIHTYGVYKYTLTDGEITIVQVTSSTNAELWVKSEINGYPVVAIGEKAFQHRTNYKKIKIPGSVKTIGKEAFYGCTKLQEVILEEGVQAIEYGAFKDLTNLETVSIPDSLLSIGDYAFYSCTKLKDQSWGNGLLTIGDYAFYDCDAISKPQFGEKLQSIGAYAFAGSNVSQLEFPDSLESISDFAFHTCNLVQSVKIGKGLCRIGIAGMAQIATGTQGYEVDPENTYFCTDAQGVLYTKDMTEVVRVPKLVTGDYKIPDGVHTVRDYAFRGCASITDLTMPDSLRTIGDYAFDGCTGVGTLKIGAGVETIGDYAFTYWSSENATIVIPDSVKKIGNYAFLYTGCSDVLVIGNNVQSIGEMAFSSVYAVETLVISGNVQQMENRAFNQIRPERVIYCGTEQQKETFLAHLATYTNDMSEAVWQFHDVVSATCTTAEYCRYCREEFAPPLGHDYVSEVTAPTCTAGGYTTHTCSRCGDTYVDNQTDRTEHSWQSGGCTGCDLTAEDLDLSADQRVSALDAQLLAEALSGCRELTPEQWQVMENLSVAEIVKYILAN